MNSTVSMAMSAISSMTGRRLPTCDDDEYVIMIRESKDNTSDVALSYPGNVRYTGNESIFEYTVLLDHSQKNNIWIHAGYQLNNADWSSEAITKYQCRPAIIYRKTETQEYVPVKNGDNLIHYIYQDTPPITMFTNYSNLLLLLQRLVEDVEPEPNDVNSKIVIYRRTFGNLVVTVEECNYRTTSLNIYNTANKSDEIVLDVAIIGKGKYVTLFVDNMAKIFDFADFDDGAMLNEKVVEDWLRFIDMNLNPSCCKYTEDNCIPIFKNNNQITESILSIVKEVVESNPNADIATFTKTLRIKMCAYALPSSTLSEVASKYIQSNYNGERLPSDAIQ